MDHELETLEQYIESARSRFDNRRRLRELNLQSDINYSSELSLEHLDSSIKKNSAFVKKLKIYSESQKTQILDDIERLNLTKFVSEVASSIIEAKLKLSDIPSVIEICTKLNRSYKEFNKQLLDQYARYFPSVKKKNHECFPIIQSSSNQSIRSGSASFCGSNSPVNNLVKVGQTRATPSESLTSNPSKIRVDLRLFSELIISGIIPLRDGFPVLMNLLCFLMIHDKNVHQNANAILTFCKGCGEELLGIVPNDVSRLSTKHNIEVPSSDLIPVKRQTLLKGYICDYYQSLVKHLRFLYEEVEQLFIKNKRSCKAKGEVSKELKQLVDTKYSEFKKVQVVINQLADLLCEDVPNLPDLESVVEIDADLASIHEIPLDNSQPTSNKNLSIWDDEGTRSFYEDLLDLKNLFPSLSVKVQIDRKKLSEPSKNKSTDELNRITDTNGSPTTVIDKNADNETEDQINRIESSSSEESLTGGDTNSPQKDPLVMVQSVASRVQPEQYFIKLANCVNRDMIDNASIDFIRFFNTKFGRRKLVKTLFNVQRTRLDLLPFYSRMTATLYPFVPNVGNELVSSLKLDFKNLFKKKDQINIESKVKNVRFIGELVKFNLYPKNEALNCLKMLLSDFTHHHIEMTCNLLETCGRLLYKSPESHHHVKLLLEQMMRKKLLLSVDSKYITMIENAYYFTNPPELIRHVVHEPPVQIYVRYLLYECLNRSTIEKVVRKIKLLNWDDKQLAKFVINCMIEAYNLKFYNIRYLAALLAALNKDYPWIPVAVIDGVVEDILLMMEINEIQFNQRRIPMIRYFGELYNYRLSDSSLVFKILYSLITYGIYYPEPNQTLGQIPMSSLDPPDNLFRIKLVCDLLDTCGQYFSSGQEKKKLDCYLLFFQRYYWYKKHVYMLHPYCMSKSGNMFPASVEYQFNDAVYNLRPTFQMATSYLQAIQSVQEFLDGLVD